MSNFKKVLIAEDSSVIQNLTRKILEFQNFEILSARNGKEVLEMISNTDIDVILLDINMPIMDGMECVQIIRMLPDTKKANVPIIAISGNARNYSVADFKAIGINEYLQKPLNYDFLVETVKRLAKY